MPATKPRKRAMTWDVFDSKYTVLTRPDGSVLWHYEEVVTIQTNNVWSVVDGDNGGMYVIPGWHVVNHVGYVVTKEPWGDREEAEGLSVKYD